MAPNYIAAYLNHCKIAEQGWKLHRSRDLHVYVYVYHFLSAVIGI